MYNGDLAAAAAYIIWGLLPIYWKQLNQLSSIYILGGRIVFSFVFCLILITVVKSWPAVKAQLHNRRVLGLTAFASALITVNWGLYIWAVNAEHIVDASMGYYLNPLLVILIGTLFFREKLSKIEWAALVVAGIGVLMMVLRYGQVPWIALGLAGTFAAYGAVKKTVNLDSQISLIIETAFAMPIFLVLLCWMEHQQMGLIANGQWQTAVLVVLSGVVTAVPLLLYGYAVKTIPFSTVGFFQYLSPTISLLVGVFIYGEAFTGEDMVIFGIIWLALLLYIIGKVVEMQKG